MVPARCKDWLLIASCWIYLSDALYPLVSELEPQQARGRQGEGFGAAAVRAGNEDNRGCEPTGSCGEASG